MSKVTLSIGFRHSKMGLSHQALCLKELVLVAQDLQVSVLGQAKQDFLTAQCLVKYYAEPGELCLVQQVTFVCVSPGC